MSFRGQMIPEFTGPTRADLAAGATETAHSFDGETLIFCANTQTAVVLPQHPMTMESTPSSGKSQWSRWRALLIDNPPRPPGE